MLIMHFFVVQALQCLCTVRTAFTVNSTEAVAGFSNMVLGAANKAQWRAVTRKPCASCVSARRSHSIQLSLRIEDAGFWQASKSAKFRGPQLFLVQPHGDV